MENAAAEKEAWKRHFEEGRAHGSAGNYELAVESFRQAIALAPDEPYPHYELGYTFLLQGRYEEALQELRKTNALVPGIFLVQREIYLSENIVAGRVSHEALEVFRALQQLTDMGGVEADEVVALSRRAIELAPSCALGYFYLGKALVRGNPEIAAKSLQHCLSLVPDDTTAIDAKIHLGLLCRDGGDLEGARRIWRSVLADYEGNLHTKMCEVLLAQYSTD